VGSLAIVVGRELLEDRHEVGLIDDSYESTICALGPAGDQILADRPGNARGKRETLRSSR
jgi:hypothetical protein